MEVLTLVEHTRSLGLCHPGVLFVSSHLASQVFLPDHLACPTGNRSHTTALPAFRTTSPAPVPLIFPGPLDTVRPVGPCSGFALRNPSRATNSATNSPLLRFSEGPETASIGRSLELAHQNTPSATQGGPAGWTAFSAPMPVPAQYTSFLPRTRPLTTNSSAVAHVKNPI